jgi:hypothetical protein
MQTLTSGSIRLYNWRSAIPPVGFHPPHGRSTGAIPPRRPSCNEPSHVDLVASFMTISDEGLAKTQPEVKPPGEQFLPPTRAAAANGPVVFEYSREAGPDETFFMVGELFDIAAARHVAIEPIHIFV